MKQLPLISVIIPFYNIPEDFFKKCVESIECQTYPNLEVLVVDDGSDPKKSGYLDSYEKKYKNLTVVHKEKNEGLFAARITGFEHSHGEYIGFVDGDDSVSMDYYRTLFRQIEKYDADICIGDWVFEFETGEKRFPVAEELRNVDINYNNEEIVERFLKDHGYNFTWQIVSSKLYKRELFANCLPKFKKFNEIAKPLIMCEDVAFSSALYLNAKRVVNAHHVYYYYFKHSQQSTNVTTIAKFRKSLKDIVNVHEVFFKEQLIEKGIYDKYAKDLQLRTQNLYNGYFNVSKRIGCEEEYYNITGQTSVKESCKEITMAASELVVLNEDVAYFESIIKNLLDKNTKVVSFDIFDTLLLRKTLMPLDIFNLVENAFKKELSTAQQPKFVEIRKFAEMHSRTNKPDGETTLDEIYDYMVSHFGFDKALAQKLKEKELEIEYDCLIPRQTGFILYDISMINNKKVVYTSDMYLPKDFLLKVLKKNSYDDKNKLYLSNEYSKTKASGKLYKVVKEDCQVKYSEITHIGDNYNADVDKARSLNINAYHLPKAKDVFDWIVLSDFNDFNFSNTDLLNSLDGFIGLRLMFAQVVNKLFDFPFLIKQSTFQGSMKYIGYFALGMHLYAFVNWIIKNSNNAQNLHFVARDGYLPMKAYDLVASQTNNLPKSNYLFMSRPFLLPLSVFDKKDLFTITNQTTIDNKNLKKIIDYFPSECINVAELNKLSKERLTKTFNNYGDFYESIPSLEKVIDFDKLKAYQQKVKKYLAEKIKPNDILVDIGYNGRGETTLTNLMDAQVNGLYVHSNSDSVHKNELLTNFNNKCFYEFKPKVTGSIREFLFMKTDASFLGYDVENNFSPIMGKSEHNEHTTFVIKTIQNNALEFIKDLMNNYRDYIELLNMFQKDAASFPYELYLQSSSYLDRSMFLNFDFEDAMGTGNVDLLKCWNNQCRYYNPQYMSNVTNVSLARFVFEKFFPKNTKRRIFASKVARKLVPAGSKRRKFVRKLLFMK